MSNPLHIVVEYELTPEADEDEVFAQIRRFVGNIAESGLAVSYRSTRRPEGAFLHFITVDDAAELEKLQAQPFFSEFAQFLRPRCAVGPAATRLSLIATT